MKKIGFLVGDLGIAGGGERVVCNLANELVKQYEVHIFHFGCSCPFEISKEVFLHDLKVNSHNIILRKLKRNKYLHTELCKNVIDVLITFGWQPSIHASNAIRGTGIKLICSERNNPLIEPASFIWKIFRNSAYKKADYLVCQTEEAKKYLNKEKSCVILNPLKDNLPIPVEGNKRDKSVINFCRLHKQKNIPLLIDAFQLFEKQHPDYELLIYGEGELREELEDYISKKEMKQKIKILPFNSNIHEQIINAGMFVSSSDYEGLSNSMVEAMALGIPSIVTDCPIYGARMVIEDGINGVIVPMNSAKEMAQEMAQEMGRLAEDLTYANKISSNALQIRESLSVNSISKKWIEVIEMVYEYE